MECSICKQVKHSTKEIKVPCFPCDVCRSLICLKCSELSQTEIRCIELKQRSMLYKCTRCRYEVVEILQNTIKDKELIIDMLHEKIKLLEQKTQTYNQPISYSEITKKNQTVQKGPTIKNNVPKIIIKPKQQQEATRTTKDLKCINPADIKVGIQNIRTSNSGTVIIKCPTKKDIDTLCEAMNEKLQDKYDISITKMRKPRIKIPNFNQNMSKEEIEKSIYEQNKIRDGIQVTYVGVNKKGTKTIYCECESSSFEAVMSLKKIYIGWERYAVYEDLTVIRCFNCQEFHHKKEHCKNSTVCSVCSGDHEKCNGSVRSCKNCIQANNKYKVGHNVSHSPSDPDCPSLKYYVELLRNKTEY